MKNRRTYDFSAEPRAWEANSTVRDLLVDGWSAYYRWRARLRNRMLKQRKRPRD